MRILLDCIIFNMTAEIFVCPLSIFFQKKTSNFYLSSLASLLKNVWSDIVIYFLLFAMEPNLKQLGILGLFWYPLQANYLPLPQIAMS